MRYKYVQSTFEKRVISVNKPFYCLLRDLKFYGVENTI